MLRLVKGLKKTKERLFSPLRALFADKGLDEESIERIEELLIAADIGLDATERIIEALRSSMGRSDDTDPLRVIGEELIGIMQGPVPGAPTEGTEGSPRVIVVVGVNGVGKTSTIGKLAHRLKGEGKSVLLAACDTFRAAAIEQLEHWADRVGVPIVRQKMGSDPAAVAFDAVQSALAKGFDTVIIDTAGRLHTKSGLMDELRKVFRVIQTRLEGACVEAWLVLDANTGQNSIRQAEAFVASLPVTGLVLTKLDSTAKGGAIIPIQSTLGLPVLFVGVGEGLEDLEPFDHRTYVSELLGVDHIDTA
jgi:fused signal recognition particle receptor